MSALLMAFTVPCTLIVQVSVVMFLTQKRDYNALASQQPLGFYSLTLTVSHDSAGLPLDKQATVCETDTTI